MKDLGAMVQDAPFHCGMTVLKEASFVAPLDSYYTEKLRNAGFVITGKTNTPELGILPTTEPVAHGATRNPYDRSRSSGGSSGGAAAAVAAGLVPVAHASDGGGSIRIPASCCGLVGLKPTRGRVSLGPTIGQANGGLVCEHVVARSVRDSAALLDILAGPMPGDPYWAEPPARPYASELGADPGQLAIATSCRFMTPQGQLQDAHADCVAAVKKAAELLESLGHTVEEASIRALERHDYVPKFIAIWAAGVAARLDAFEAILDRRIAEDEVEPLTWALAQMGRGTSAPTYMNAWSWMEANNRKIAEHWETYDLYLTPTVSEPPPPLGSFDAPEGDPLAAIYRAGQFAAFTPAFNATGQPAISLPLHRNADGLPIGVQLVAAYGREDLLIRVAAQLEQAQPFEHLP
jgi:amidase